MANAAVDNAFAWDRLASWYVDAARLPTSTANYGPDLPTDADLRLVGDVKGKRVLDLGCGAAQSAIAFTKAGARVIGVDASAELLAAGRKLAEAEEVRVELRQGDLADLGLFTSASIDLVFSAMALGFVDDLARVFRQVHRVLRPGAPFLFSLPHPLARIVRGAAPGSATVARTYWDPTPLTTERNGVPFTEYPHTVTGIFTQLHRAGFSVEVLLEPEPPAGITRTPLWEDRFATIPQALIIRARKEGI
jgi:SAM-dependent methyltransferase